MTEVQIFALAKQEIDAARTKHPYWPADVIHGAAIVGKESGELTQATLQLTYEGGTVEHCVEEAIQVIATAVRFLADTPTFQDLPEFLIAK